MPRGLHGGEPALGVALGAGGAAAFAGDPAPMRASANPGIFPVSPVEEVMPTCLASCGVIGNLVGGEPGLVGRLLRQLVEFRGARRIRDAELAQGAEGGKRRSRLDGELIERQMLAGERQRLAQLGAPSGKRLVGPGIDQVEGKAREGAPHQLDGRDRLGGRMQATQRPQLPIIERLHAKRYAVDPGGAVASEATCLNA
jgi:hypothetical protein